MKSYKRLLLIGQIIILGCSSTLAHLGQDDKTPLDDSLVRDGRWKYNKVEKSIRGELCNAYGMIEGEKFVTFKVQGWDRFTAVVATTTYCGRGPNTLSIQRGTEKETAKYVLGETGGPTYIDICLDGFKTLTLSRPESCPPIIIGDPMLHKGPCKSR